MLFELSCRVLFSLSSKYSLWPARLFGLEQNQNAGSCQHTVASMASPDRAQARASGGFERGCSKSWRAAPQKSSADAEGLPLQSAPAWAAAGNRPAVSRSSQVIGWHGEPGFGQGRAATK